MSTYARTCTRPQVSPDADPALESVVGVRSHSQPLPRNSSAGGGYAPGHGPIASLQRNLEVLLLQDSSIASQVRARAPACCVLRVFACCVLLLGSSIASQVHARACVRVHARVRARLRAPSPRLRW